MMRANGSFCRGGSGPARAWLLATGFASGPSPDRVCHNRAHNGGAADDVVFSAPGGGPLRLGNWRQRVFDPACAAVGLVGLTPHDLRHTAASLAIAAGANVKAVQRMLVTPPPR